MSYNPYLVWKREHLTTLERMEELFKEDQPTIGGGDTESTGLHIIHDQAFLIVFGWLVPNTDYGRVFTFYPTQDNMKIFFDLAKKLKQFWFHNATIDLHFMKNIGYMYDHDNLYDSMTLGRLVFEAVPAREGGDSLKLKDMGVKYVHPDAGNSDKLVKEELKKLNAERRKVLAVALAQYDHPTDKKHTPFRQDKKGEWKRTTTKWAWDNPDQVKWEWVPEKWNATRIDDFLKNIENDVEDLPPDVREVWENWQEEYPEPTYADVDRELMIKYAGEDVITMLEFVKKSWHVLVTREQLNVMDRERKGIMPNFSMERTGFKTDRDYLKKSRLKTKAYIIKMRTELRDIAGEDVTVNQHNRIKEIYKEKWGITLASSDKASMKRVIENCEGDPKRFAELINTLRSTEKWYSTYILRLLKSSEKDGRAYTQINTASAVSGRVGSDFQQFPRDALLTQYGQELKRENQEIPESEILFHPRKAIIPTGGDYGRIYYLDYSQIELRTQAFYTLKVSGGDTNLCRAYMPFKCYKKDDKGNVIHYDFKSKKKRDEWKDGDWYVDTGKVWTPTDVHSETSHNALVLLGYECLKKGEHYIYKGTGIPFFPREIKKDEFKKVRDKGKTFNFMRNYGGGLRAAMELLELPENVALALIDGFNQAFPHVAVYQRKVIEQHRKNGYVVNMFGRRYYLEDGDKAYKLANYLIQGTCADAIKEAIILIHDYLKDKKSRMLLPVHDELQFEIFKGEEWIIPDLLRIMESVFEDWCLVPVVCDAEYTETNWAEKQAV